LWFERWCNDEFRHGEAFALIMRANPHLLTGLNKYWIRFFCLAVYSTMYVRDHSRPQLYKAMQISPTDYDKKVLRITNEITKQVFPITLNLDDPRFYECMNQMLALFQKMDVYKARGGLLAKVMVPLLGVRAGLVFARAYFLPVHNHELPRNVRLVPSW
jgi:magnesium-protoporphyrin IX monomethyl ester (oxidative) cyclase